MADPDRAAAVLAEVPGVLDVRRTTGGLSLRLVGNSRADVVRALVDADIDIARPAPQHGLEGGLFVVEPGTVSASRGCRRPGRVRPLRAVPPAGSWPAGLWSLACSAVLPAAAW